VIPGGHSYAALRSAAALSPSARIEEQWSGISQLQHLAAVDETTQAGDIGAALARMRELVFRPDGLVAGITASEDAIADARAAVKRVVDELPGSSTSNAGEATTSAAASRAPIGAGRENSAEDPALNPAETSAAGAGAGEAPRVESLLVPASVNYVATAFAGAPITLPDYSGDLILSHLLKTGLLWEYVRMRGGAYGAVAATRSLEGVFLFASYRDPQLLQTLQAYRDALEALAQEPVSEDELELAIIGTVGAQIRPFAPGEKGMISLKRYLFGIRDELRQAKRDELLAMQPEQVRLAAERLLHAFSEKRVAVIGSREAVEEAGKEMPELLEHVTQIPM
jgi:Zn-dependent M16 (insulinase) family peptidase